MSLMFRPLKVAEVRRETADALSILFDVPPELSEAYRFSPGQYLTLRVDVDGKDIRRNYSVCASPLDGELRVAVKLLPGGMFSAFAGSLKAGDTVDVLPAIGHFTVTFSADHKAHYAAFAAGSGITPVLSLLRTALAVEPSSRFTLFYGNRTGEQILFLEELAGLKNRFMGRLELFNFLSMEEEDIELFNGRLDRAKCEQILSTVIDPSGVERFFVCGPEGMMEAAEQALLARGVPAAKILLERFVSAGAPVRLDDAAQAKVKAAAGRRMEVILDGRKRAVAFDEKAGNILDSVRAAGLSAPYACKGGVCATCRAKVVSGTVDMRLNYGLSAEEVTQGYVLTCQATPTSDDVVLTYDG